MRLSLLLLLVSVGCQPATTTDDTQETDTMADNDGDGFTGDADCNEEDGTVHDGAAELCDGVDNDCDGEIDDGATNASTFYRDADEDTYGDPGQPTTACAAPAGYVADDQDCDDANAAYNPGAVEADCADPNDYNCDGSVQFEDADSDGFAACEDCDDEDGAVHPGATEVCNEVDDDCNDSVDDNPVDAATWYLDDDGDGYGTDTTVLGCTMPEGAAEYAGDCDDTQSAYHPNAEEIDCADPNDYNCDGSVGYTDADGDGYAACEECDDTSAANFPGAVEYCDNLDNDCDTVVDEPDAVDASTWYADADGDSFGDAATTQTACDQPAGYTTDTTDCDDSNADEYPGALELCDGDDDNCDGVVDETTAVDATTWYMDADSDGYGDAATSEVACDQPAGYLGNADDCDDTDLSEHPGAAELCDGDDDNCDGVIDEATATDVATWYADADGDTYGDPAVTMEACDQPADYVADFQDCDDTSAAVSPAGEETCNGVDDNCDGDVDEALSTDAVAWFADSDADGYGDPASSVLACGAPAGFVADSTDCDDTNALAHPGASEACDGFDDDCDGTVDEDASIDVATWFQDADGDGYGDAALSDIDCDQPSGFVADSTDCDDAATAVNPAAAEVCDGANVDEDCSGSADDADAGASGQTTWYTDSDGDGYGDSASSVSLCDQPAATSATGGDCDDGAVGSNPGETETTGDGIDEDCSGGETCWVDADSDGYREMGTTTVASADDDCADAGEGAESEPATDCDDAEAATNPGASEYCNGHDDDCDSAVDEDAAVDVATWFYDGDSDGYGDAALSDIDCDAPSGYVADSTDCNDAASAVNPGAAEVCDPADVDEDCSGAADDDDATATGQSAWYADADSDGYGDAADQVSLCDQPFGYVSDSDDCDDADTDVNPGAAEVCDAANVDEDCSGAADDDDATATGQTSWYTDGDGDGYGDATLAESACDEPSGAVADDTDCNDAAFAVHPGATETVANGRDDDCDGSETCYEDDDDDNYLDTTGDTLVSADGDCSDAYEALATALTTDCDEAEASVHPGATETCNEVDDDCDLVVDDGVTAAYYLDFDSDGYGDAAVPSSGCSAPAGYVANSSDCDDGNGDVNPAAAEVCDASDVDENCNNAADDLDATATGQSSWYADADTDTFGDAAVAESACDQPASFVADDQDCDDTLATAYPGAPETVADGVDQDCDGGETCFEDDDSDGYLDLSGDTVASTDPDCSDAGEALATALTTDCDDAEAAVNPGATETCNSVDDNCDGVVDEGTTGTFYADTDEDGYGDASSSTSACAAGGGYVADSTDCDDGATGVNPGAAEVCDNFIDDNCSGDADACEPSGKASLASSADVILTGTVATDYSGTATAMGDFNGDGYGDLVIGSNGYDTSTSLTNMGRAYVFWGPFDGTETLATADIIYTGGKGAGDNLGTTLANAGDIDLDGDDELLIGAHLVNDAATDSGAGYLIKGSSSWTSKTITPTSGANTAFISSSTVATEYVGWSLAGAGDVNGDGADDVLVGAYLYNYSSVADSGVAALWYGGTTGTSEAILSADVLFTGTVASQGVGYTVSTAGDLDGDGFSEFIVASSVDDTLATNAGSAWLVYGPASASVLTPATADAVVNGTSASDGLGVSAAGIGDFNGDGADEFAIGVDKGDGTVADSGLLLIFSTAITGSVAPSAADVIIAGTVASDYAGHDVAGAGDVNADGVADIVFGVGGYDETSGGNEGGIALAYGPMTSATYSTADGFWYGAASDGWSTSSNVNVSMAGGADLDADGFDDFVYGSTESDPAAVSRAGSTWLFYGGGE